MENIQEFKKNVRREVKSKGKNLDPDYRAKSDKSIMEQIISLKEYQDCKVLFTFVGQGGEPDTEKIILDALSRGKVVCAPVCLNKTDMEARQIRSLDDLEKGMYGLREPKSGLPVMDKKDIDFSLIPCVTCDKQGNRVGYGMGYYDRYLEGTDFYTCMICRAELMVDEAPTEEHDIKMDNVIYDK